jgi:nucleotide-binding universal stress UspA family protein
MANQIWFTFDPFQKKAHTQADALNLIAPYARTMQAEIQPVYFADLFRGTDSGSFWFPLIPLSEKCTLKELTKIVTKKWDDLVAKTQYNALPLKILTHNKDDIPSLETKALRISDEARKKEASMVAIQTRGHHGLKRMAMGSFTETFLLHTKVPTLVIPPVTSRSSDLKQKTGSLFTTPKDILFATDLSPVSLLAFKKMAPLFKMLKVKITLFFHLEIAHDIINALDPEFKTNVINNSLVKKLKPEINERASDFFEIATNHDLKIKLHIHSSPDPIAKSDAIIEAANNLKLNCVALAAQSNRLKTSLIGATSRELVRKSTIPVLIYRPSIG